MSEEGKVVDIEIDIKTEDMTQITPHGIPQGPEYVEFDHMSTIEKLLHWQLEDKEINNEYIKAMNQLCQMRSFQNNDIITNDKLIKTSNNVENSQYEMMEKQNYLKQLEKDIFNDVSKVMKHDDDKIKQLKKIQQMIECGKSDTKYIGKKNKKKCFCCNGIKGKKMKKCSKCRFAFYCSKLCQKQHWSIHKLNCKEIKVETKIETKTKKQKKEKRQKNKNKTKIK